MNKHIIFKSKCIVHNVEREEKEKTYLRGYNYLKGVCVGEIDETLTKEEMAVIDDVLKGVARRRNLKNKKLTQSND